MQRSSLLPSAGSSRSPISSSSTSSPSSGGDSASRLEPEVQQLLNLISSSFQQLISPTTTVIGQVEEVDRMDEDADTATDPTPSSSLQPVPLSPTSLPYSLLHTRSLTQQTVLQTSAATLIDSCERLLGVVSQLRLHRTLHDRTRFAEEGRLRRQRVVVQTEVSQKMRRQLEVDVRKAIETLEAHYHHSVQHRHNNTPAITTHPLVNT